MDMVHARLLIVEDENIIAKDIQRRLTRLGYSVPAIASSGRDALQKTADVRPDLVLMDIVLKGDMDGVDTAARVQTRFQIPVVYLTAYADEHTWQRAVAMAPFGYVLKPVIDRQLQTVIEIALDKHRTERHIAASEKQLFTTLRCVGDAIIATNTEGRITFMNPAAEFLTGWSQDDAYGQHVEQVCRIVVEATQSPVVHPLREAMRIERIGRPHNDRLALITRHGQRLPIEENATPLRDEHGVTIGSVLVFRDITARQRTEEALLTARTLEAVGTLAGGIAHNFNNILMVIMGRLSLAKLHVRSNEPLSTQLSEAERATQQATDVARQLLTFAQGGTPVKQLTTLRPLLQETCQRTLAGSQTQYIVTAGDDLWSIEVDRGQIRQVFHNIIVNAREAMRAPGTLRMLAENVTLSDTDRLPLAAGPYVQISIIDQGEGIPPAHLDKVFHPYFTTKERGRGLGLAIAHAIVEKHNGQILITSVVGESTVVHIYLPARPDATVSREGAMPRMQTGQGKILIMDDEEVIRILLSSMLSRLGYTVESAREGAEALALYRRAQEAGEPFDAVIMDLMIIDGMDGKEAIDKLREMDPQVKAIVSSGYSNDQVLADFQRYGFQGVLAKPYHLEELSTVLQQVIHRTNT
jgi:PAS domain S-box-containing protein